MLIFYPRFSGAFFGYQFTLYIPGNLKVTVWKCQTDDKGKCWHNAEKEEFPPYDRKPFSLCECVCVCVYVCVCVCVCVCVNHSVVSDPVTPGTVARQAPLSMGFSRQEYWSGLPFSPPGDRLDPGIEPMSPHCRQTLYHLSHQGSPKIILFKTNTHSSLKQVTISLQRATTLFNAHIHIWG